MEQDPPESIPLEHRSATPYSEWYDEVAHALATLRMGVDNFYAEYRKGDAASVIWDACHELTLLGVNLPISGSEYLGGEGTTVEDDVAALAHWVYGIYDEECPWATGDSESTQ